MQKIKKIEETISNEISPSLKQDGGNIELVDVIGNRVLVKMQGSCAVCKASQQTLKNFVEAKLREMVWPELVVGGGDPMKTIYLDNNATTRVAPEVLEEMHPYFHELYGNPSSAHTFGGQVGRKIREARERAALLLGVAPGEILFTSCGSESDNAAIRSALQLNPDKRHIVTSRVEHPAIKSFCDHLAQNGYRITEIPVDKDGNLDMAVYEKNLTPDTAIASSCGATTKPASFSRWKKPPPLPKSAGFRFIRMGSRWRAKSPST